MNSYRFNQIAMAVLGALLLIFATRTLVKIAMEEPEAEKPGYEVAGAKKPSEEKPAAQGDNILALIATADPAKGAEVAKKCQLCHNFDKGGPNLIGPNLYGVLGRDIGSHEGYEYSETLKGLPGNWDYLKIDGMITNPAAYAPGTKMALFQGLPDAKQRAEVLAFLRTKNDNPPPLPEASAAAPTEAPAKHEAAKPAEEDIAVLLAHSDATRGAEVAKKCQICHNFDKGGPNLIGPNLYGVLGRDVASHEGYEYSEALKAKGGKWDYASVNAMITSPAAYVPGTKMMLFQGLPDAKQRGDVLLFLRTKNDNPPPLPEPAGGAAAPAAAPAAETPAAPKAEEPAPAAETPAAPAPAAPAPSAETPAAPSAETPAAPAEEPARAAPPPSAETPAARAEKPAPSTPAPSAETPAAPSAETPAAPAEEAAPSAETPASESAPNPLTGQPQPVYPDGAPSVEAPAAPVEEPAPSAETPASESAPDPLAGQPQPVYPDGPPQN